MDVTGMEIARCRPEQFKVDVATLYKDLAGLSVRQLSARWHIVHGWVETAPGDDDKLTAAAVEIERDIMVALAERWSSSFYDVAKKLRLILEDSDPSSMGTPCYFLLESAAADVERLALDEVALYSVVHDD